MSSRSFNFSVHRGLTLIEVIAALAIVSTLLVGLLIGANRHADQIRRARRTTDVVARVDALLYSWTGSGGLVLRDAEGDLPGEDELVWKTHLVNTAYRQDLGVDVYRLEVFSKAGPVDEPPIVSLELAVPSPEWPPAGETP